MWSVSGIHGYTGLLSLIPVTYHPPFISAKEVLLEHHFWSETSVLFLDR